MLSLALSPQDQIHDVSVVNIEIPVRVFRGETFIDNLTLEDFEVFENGIRQKIEAVYLIKKKSVEKGEGSTRFTPSVSRSFVLMFEIIEYLPRVGESIDYFFANVLLPGDELTVITPVKAYQFNSKAFELMSGEQIAAQLKGKLRSDAISGNSEYRNLVKELQDVLALNMPIDEKMSLFRQVLTRLETVRSVDEERMLNFANFLKEKEGQKNVFMFYQKDVLPQLDVNELNRIIHENQERIDIQQNVSELFEFYRRDINFDVENVKQIFSDSSISMHFLFITKRPAQNVDVTRFGSLEGLTMAEQSEDVFSTFREMAQATGGFIGSSFYPTETFKKAVDASQNYYLLYYSPSNYKPDGKFKNVKVRVKGRNYRVTHRAGYFAD
jgi:hypothetical protein